MAFQNRIAVDMLLAEKGGVCAVFGDQCCTFIPNNTASDGSLTLAIEGLRTLNSKMKEHSGAKTAMWDEWMNVFGKGEGAHKEHRAHEEHEGGLPGDTKLGRSSRRHEAGEALQETRSWGGPPGDTKLGRPSRRHRTPAHDKEDEQTPSQDKQNTLALTGRRNLLK
ncbi:hypothetical protein D4764_0279220 [Takifugu flavidus]|uniref:Uncharacterized protein n=1 Tax=Takifugu flavidus TaxID=433684 RepID=A0A5C6MJY7_9TELE|nr:hypothetical protein D4764_0279220 [Takifugu flavidus]